MKCPKCRQDNPEGTLFCENCDHRMDRPVVKDKPFMPPRYAALIAVALGAVSILFYFATNMWYAPAIAGAVGLLLGSYSFTLIWNTRKDGEKVLLIIAAAAMALSVIGFMLGIRML